MDEREMVSADEAQVFAQVAERTGHGDSLAAWHNRDGSIAVRLYAVPLDGVMQIREEVSR